MITKNVLNSFIPVKISVDGFRSSPFELRFQLRPNRSGLGLRPLGLGLRPHKQGSLLRLSGYAGQARFKVGLAGISTNGSILMRFPFRNQENAK